MIRVEASWLALREHADGAARAGEFADELAAALADRPSLLIHDLAAGTGAMTRWLAPRLTGPQQWIAHDLDGDLLEALDAAPAVHAADGSPVTVRTLRHDVTALAAGELAGADLVTSSALLDLLTADELGTLVARCTEARCPVLFTLTVTGTVLLWPPDPADPAVSAAFNAHQRRTTAGRTLLGPDAAAEAVRRFTDAGWQVVTRGSPWRLGPASRALTRAWFAGWWGAACEHDPELGARTSAYAAARLADAAAGRLRVLVHHRDLLVRPPAGTSRRGVGR